MYDNNMTLHQIGLKHGTDKAAFHGYCDFYEQELQGLNPKRILEIGVKDGASLRMWKEFYPDAEVVGIDINEPIEVPGCKVFKMDQTDVYHLLTLGGFDLIIEDGSHMTLHQQITFMFLFNNSLHPGGIYIIEDIHTSFYTGYINSHFTTYDLFAGTANTRLFQRIPGDTSDSNTIIIKK